MNNLIVKLKFNNNPLIVNLPNNLDDAFEPLTFTTKINKKQKSEETLIFASNLTQLESFLEQYNNIISYDSVYWIAFEKGKSKLDGALHRDLISATAAQYHLKTVSAIAINETWSALRLRPLDKVGK